MDGLDMYKLRFTLTAFAALLAGSMVAFGADSLVLPYEEDTSFIPASAIDNLVLANLKAKGIKPANLCSDEVFVRRVYLDVIGTLPTGAEAKAFLASQEPDKRAKLIDKLLEREEYADYWSLKWCDLLRVKAEYPINLWPNAVQAYHRWIHDAIKRNMPYNQFARELLTSSGSNFRTGPVNFYRAVQGKDPNTIAAAVALTFMGTRLEKWEPQKRKDVEKFFSRIAYKPTEEWKEEIVILDPAKTEPMKAVLPNGAKVTIQGDQDPRRVFADWLMSPGNAWFARNICNRQWSWLMGRGIIQEPDDIRADNPPSNLKLLTYLEGELVKSKYDMKHMFRLILNSRTYQQSSIPQSTSKEAEAQFAFYPVRRLDAEVLVDALCAISGTQESYSSPIPEPFTFIPGGKHSIELEDGSISSTVLEVFGRPSRDTGLESERDNRPTDSQRLYLLNSTDVQNRVQNGAGMRKLINGSGGDRRKMLDSIYLTILSRYPTEAEVAAADKYYETKGLNTQQASCDVAWALVNSKEFLYRH
jgi:hypothetical protein